MSRAELAGEYAVSGGTGDPEFVADRLAEMQQQQVAQTREQAGHGDVKRRLEQKTGDTRTIQVLGEPVEFESPGAGVMRRATHLRQRALNDDPDAELELYDFVFETLAGHSVDPGMDEDWWGQFEFGALQQVFEDLALGTVDPETRGEIESFRNE